MAIPFERRVGVTGLGIISPCGNTINHFSTNIFSGSSGIRKISSVRGEALSVKIAAEVDFSPSDYFSDRQASTMDRISQFALGAGSQAWKDRGLILDSQEKARAGVYLGVGLGGANTIEEVYDRLFRKKSDRVKALSVLMIMPSSAATLLSIEYGLSGPCLTFSTACSSSANAVGEAYPTDQRWICGCDAGRGS